MCSLFERNVLRNEVYASEKIMYSFDHFIRYMPRVLQKDSKNKTIFKILSLFLLSVSDKELCSLSKEIHRIVFMVETAFLQYFHIGSEETQEMKITYNELLKMFSTNNEEII